MRINLTFEVNKKVEIPINYNYFLTSLIYHILRTSDKGFSEFLHERGFSFEGRNFKLFTYSHLIFEHKRIEQDRIINLGSKISWFVSSPVNEFVEHFVDGVFRKEGVWIERVALFPERVETLPEPVFNEREYFTCLSPLTMSVGEGHYLRMDEQAEFSQKIHENLLRKYRLLYNSEPANNALEIEFDREYLTAHPRPSRLIDFKGIKIRGYMAPFYAAGSPELMRLGYECGFGDKNSAGFGMVKVMQKAL